MISVTEPGFDGSGGDRKGGLSDNNVHLELKRSNLVTKNLNTLEVLAITGKNEPHYYHLGKDSVFCHGLPVETL
jgi:hypothetical protein